MFLFKNSIMSTFLPSVCFLREILSDWSGSNTDQKHRRLKWYRISDTFCEWYRSIDTFVSIDDFDTLSIVSPITTSWNKMEENENRGG
jgi:hypothetical protein